MRWAGHVARIGEGRTELCTGLWWESPKERRHSHDRGVDGIRMDLRGTGWGGCGVDSVGSGWGPVAGCEHGDEAFGFRNTYLLLPLMLLLLLPLYLICRTAKSCFLHNITLLQLGFDYGCKYKCQHYSIMLVQREFIECSAFEGRCTSVYCKWFPKMHRISTGVGLLSSSMTLLRMVYKLQS
jgi:hypothetical protein